MAAVSLWPCLLPGRLLSPLPPNAQLGDEPLAQCRRPQTMVDCHIGAGGLDWSAHPDLCHALAAGALSRHLPSLGLGSRLSVVAHTHKAFCSGLQPTGDLGADAVDPGLLVGGTAPAARKVAHSAGRDCRGIAGGGVVALPWLRWGALGSLLDLLLAAALAVAFGLLVWTILQVTWIPAQRREPRQPRRRTG